MPTDIFDADDEHSSFFRRRQWQQRAEVLFYMPRLPPPFMPLPRAMFISRLPFMTRLPDAASAQRADAMMMPVRVIFIMPGARRGEARFRFIARL